MASRSLSSAVSGDIGEKGPVVGAQELVAEILDLRPGHGPDPIHLLIQPGRIIEGLIEHGKEVGPASHLLNVPEEVGFGQGDRPIQLLLPDGPKSSSSSKEGLSRSSGFGTGVPGHPEEEEGRTGLKREEIGEDILGHPLLPDQGAIEARGFPSSQDRRRDIRRMEALRGQGWNPTAPCRPGGEARRPRPPPAPFPR